MTWTITIKKDLKTHHMLATIDSESSSVTTNYFHLLCNQQ